MIEIKNKKNCCGCTACSNICPAKCIKMAPDEEGFLYPLIDKSKCIKCGACEKVCPILNVKKDEKIVPECFSAYSKDEDVLLKSSSGGIFFHIAKCFIEKFEGVVYGANYYDGKVFHIKVEDVTNLDKLLRSKYIQSEMGDVFLQIQELLIKRVNILFCGTPCQIEGLQHFLKKNYDNLYCVDIICHGVPSQKVWKKYLDFYDVKSGAEINFRDKSNGWKDYNLKLGDRVCGHQNDLYMKSFLNEYNLRPSCYDCKFKKINRQSDMTLGDFWGIENVDKEAFNKNGTSVVLVHTKKGKSLFEAISKDIYVKKEKFDDCISYNQLYAFSALKPIGRKKFFDNLEKVPFDDLVNKFCKRTFMDKVVRKIKKVLLYRKNNYK